MASCGTEWQVRHGQQKHRGNHSTGDMEVSHPPWDGHKDEDVVITKSIALRDATRISPTDATSSPPRRMDPGKRGSTTACGYATTNQQATARSSASGNEAGSIPMEVGRAEGVPRDGQEAVPMAES